jgi:hypothetical protein
MTRALLAIVLFAVGLVGCASHPAGTPAPARESTTRISFAVIGDIGYTPEEEPATASVFADVNRTAGLAFVVHVGDLAAPRYGCTDELLERRLAQFRASAHPLIFTPGDNDWTDCHEPAVKGTDPAQRLAKVRAMFFAGDRSLGQRTIALTRQSQSAEFARYRENVRWDLGGVTFVTLHVPGSNNGFGRTPESTAEYTERNRANLAWLKAAFAHAKAANSRALMILQQANLFPAYLPFPGDVKKVEGFADERTMLETEVKAFAKPVVLVHGDSHYFRIDKPLTPQRVRGAVVTPSLENFTRVEGFGTPYHHWVQITIEPGEPNVFTFQPRIVAANLTPPRSTP